MSRSVNKKEPETLTEALQLSQCFQETQRWMDLRDREHNERVHLEKADRENELLRAALKKLEAEAAALHVALRSASPTGSDSSAGTDRTPRSADRTQVANLPHLAHRRRNASVSDRGKDVHDSRPKHLFDDGDLDSLESARLRILDS